MRIIIIIVILLVFVYVFLIYKVIKCMLSLDVCDNSEFEARIDEKRADITKRKEALYDKNRDNSTRF